MKFSKIYTMISIIKLFTLLATCFISLNIAAQNVQSDLENIRKKYDEFTNVSYDTEYKSYMNKVEEKPVDVAYGKVLVSGINKYQKVGNVEIITNKYYSFTVDHDEKDMYLSQITNPQEVSSQMDLSKLLSNCKVDAQEKIDERHYTYTLTIQHDVEVFKTVKIIYDPKTYMVSELHLYYRKPQEYLINGKMIEGKPIMLIKFSNYKTNQKLSSSIFTYDKFLTNVSGKLKPNDSFKKYSINGQEDLVIKK